MVKEKESKGLGIASMVIGIMGVFGSWIPFLGMPPAFLGLILGLLQKNWTQQGTATTGVVLNGIWTGIQLIFIFLMLVGLMAGA